MRKTRFVLGSLLMLGLLATAARAETINWIGGVSWNNWTVGGNWSGGALPSTGDTAVIATGSASMAADLSPAPDVIQIDAGGRTVATGSSITNDLVLNGGIIDMSGDANPTMSGTITLTANSTIQNTRGNSNRSFKVNGNIIEDGTPRKLFLSGNPTVGGSLSDTTNIGGTNTYSGGTEVLGATNSLNNVAALGTGPVTVTAGRLAFKTAGDYTHGKVTVTGGTVIVGTNGIENEVWEFQGGTLTYDHQPRTLDVTNNITITDTTDIIAGGGYYNNPFNINTPIGGTGKAVLNTGGGGSVLIFGIEQQWTGGTDVKGIVTVTDGSKLPAGTVTVYPVAYNAGTGLLRISGAAGLDPATDLVLLHDAGSGVSGTIAVAGDQIVHSLTIDGQVIDAGFYSNVDFPDYILGTGTIRVMTPDVGPNAIMDLAGTSPDWFKVALTWTAPADNIDPIASAYDIRYSTSTIDDSNWDAATPVANPPVPQAPGLQESLTVLGLQGNTTYYFAVKSSDAGDNWGTLSNIAAVTTIATDAVQPNAVTDLAVVDTKPNRLTVRWTATGDDGSTGTASVYDLRYSTSPISTEADFSSANQVTGLPIPQAAGAVENATVSGLNASTTYYFAVKVGDEVPNWSALSNVASGTTSPPDYDPPVAVADLAAKGVGIHDVTLGWTAPADVGSAGTDNTICVIRPAR